MTGKLTITVEDDVDRGPRGVIGRRKTSRFLNDLARPHVLQRDLAQGCRDVAADEARERDAVEWVAGLTGDMRARRLAERIGRACRAEF